MGRCNKDHNFVRNTRFSDEATFYFNAIVNRPNASCKVYKFQYLVVEMNALTVRKRKFMVL